MEIVHILFHNNWVDKTLFSRYIYKIFCVIGPCIRIELKAEIAGQALKITC